jgi:hypothetical protein
MKLGPASSPDFTSVLAAASLFVLTSILLQTRADTHGQVISLLPPYHLSLHKRAIGNTGRATEKSGQDRKDKPVMVVAHSIPIEKPDLYPTTHFFILHC